MIENRLLLRVWSNKLHKYLTDTDIWDIFDSDAEDVWELLSEVNNPSTKYLAEQLKEYRLTFEQCTGIKDKNGKLIYEGDIVKWNNILFKPSVVSWEYNPYTSSVGLCAVDKNTKIIGNIHENPKLMEDSNE